MTTKHAHASGRHQRPSGTPRKRGVPSRSAASAKRSKKSAAKSKAGKSLRSCLRIVIADDHEIVRSGLRALLEADGRHEVCGEAADGIEAISEAEEKQPDVVLLDVSMPRMSGLETVRGVTRASPDSFVVMVTVNESAEQIRDAFDAGADGYVLKRDASRELLNALDVVRQKRKFRSSGCPRP